MTCLSSFIKYWWSSCPVPGTAAVLVIQLGTMSQCLHSSKGKTGVFSFMWLLQQLITNGWLKTTVYSLQFWRPEIQNPGIRKAAVPLEAGGENPLFASSSFWLFSAFLDLWSLFQLLVASGLWLVDVFLQPVPLPHCCLLFCLCCLPLPPLYKDAWTAFRVHLDNPK